MKALHQIMHDLISTKFIWDISRITCLKTTSIYCLKGEEESIFLQRIGGLYCHFHLYSLMRIITYELEISCHERIDVLLLWIDVQNLALKCRRMSTNKVKNKKDKWKTQEERKLTHYKTNKNKKRFRIELIGQRILTGKGLGSFWSCSCRGLIWVR